MSDESKTEIDAVATALREHRAQRRLTLAELAAMTGISAAHLSRMEKGERVPTIGMLLLLGRAYGIPLGDLVGEKDATSSVYVNRGSSRSTRVSKDATFTSLSSPRPTANLQAISMELLPGRTSDPVAHPGEEWIYVLSGKADVVVADETYSLDEGDSIHFESDKRHYLTNPWTVKCMLLLVSAAGTSRHHQEGVA